MIKELIKAIMLRTRFRLQFLKMKISEARTNYNKQRNIWKCFRMTYRNTDFSLELEEAIKAHSTVYSNAV